MKNKKLITERDQLVKQISDLKAHRDALLDPNRKFVGSRCDNCGHSLRIKGFALVCSFCDLEYGV